MTADIVQKLLKIADAVGDAGYVGVDGDGHDAGVFCAFLVEAVELVDAAF